MGTGIFIMAILGCGDAGSACAPVHVLPTAFASREACMAATDAALDAQSSLDFPTIVAECRAGKPPASSSRRAPEARALAFAPGR